MILAQYDESGQIIDASALLSPRRDRVDATAARHAYNRAKHYAERMLQFKDPVDQIDEVEKFSSAMDKFLPFCLFCRRYMELVPICQLRGFSVSVAEVPESEHHGISNKAVQKDISLKVAVERVIHCHFHYPISKDLTDDETRLNVVIAGCEVKSNYAGVFQIGFRDLIDPFLNHLPTELENLERQQRAEDDAERAKMLKEFYQSERPQKLAQAAIAELKREGEA